MGVRRIWTTRTSRRERPDTALALTLFTLGARRLPAIETALIGALDAPLWVWIASRETPGPLTLLGGAIVFSAVAAHIVLSARTEGAPGA